jgi:2-oxoglutarate ferredoxin oxidoreductase subunit alpha
MKVNIVIAGAAGQGLKTLNNILSKIFFRLGYDIYSTKDYMSRIRGGHNFMSIRIGNEKITSSEKEIDLLIALNSESIEIHKSDIKKDGVILFDGDVTHDQLINIPAKEIAKEIGNRRVSNMAFVGSVLKILGINIKEASEIVTHYFDADETVAEANIQSLEKGYNLLDEKLPLPTVEKKDDQILINGNDAVGFGGAIGGVQFYSAYPMTPSTGILNYMAKHSNEMNIAVEQAEDEIAAVNMALGASYGGIRAMTGTSGGGFALMNETIGLISLMELPLVIANVQRPGPATGMPTRTSQGDLSFIINSSSGEFPLVVSAPRHQKDAFYQTYKAMNLSEKYQMPFIILTDQYLADTKQNFKTFDIDALENKNYYFNNKEKSDIEDFKRYELTENGISHLTYPGQLSNSYVIADSHEHTEFGRISEDIDVRNKMVEKRQRKLDYFIEEDLEEPIYKGPENPDYILISWGSTYSPCLEAIQDFDNIGLLSFNHVWPLPTKKLNEYAKTSKFIVIENNSIGQFAKLIRQETCLTIDSQILKYDGRPFTSKEIVNRIKNEVL